METYKKFKTGKHLLRMYIIGTGLLMTIYCCLLCFGIRHFFAELICFSGAYFAICVGAWIFNLCWISWAFVFYTYAVRICILLYGIGFWDDKEGLLGMTLLHTAHLIAFAIGAFLTVCLCVRYRKYYSIFIDYYEQSQSNR